MTVSHDPYRCPACNSTRTRSMRIVVATGTRIGRSVGRRVTVGARGWWSVAASDWNWTSRTALAARYSPASPIGLGGILVLTLLGTLISGMTGAALGLVLGIVLRDWLTPEVPDGFVCLRCGCEFPAS